LTRRAYRTRAEHTRCIGDYMKVKDKIKEIEYEIVKLKKEAKDEEALLASIAQKRIRAKTLEKVVSELKTITFDEV
jgi:hypothetical protein